MKKFNYWIPVIIWAAIIFAFSSQPTNSVSTVYWQEFTIKKTAHVIEYAIFTTLLYRAFRNTNLFDKVSSFIPVIISTLYGFSDEFHQQFTPGREPRIRDVIFDIIGSVLAFWVIVRILPKTKGVVKVLAKRLELI